MKKYVSLLLILIMLAAAAACHAETPVFETLAGLGWSFCSGVGAWSTDMYIQADGSFRGEFHDGEMGDCADEYPYGTVYFCSFSGRMSLTEQVDERTWKIRVDSLAKDPAEEIISGGTRYIPAEPYGLSEGDIMLLYSPGTPVSIFSEDMRMWTHVQDLENPPAELQDWFLCSESNESGFVGYQLISLANPWEDLTAVQLAETSGLSFGVPEGAENVIYRYLRSEGLAEMQFSMAGGDYCARIQPMAPEENQLSDISGMYCEWTQEEPVSIGSCPGSLSRAQDGEYRVERCLWYDAAAHLMYSLTVTAQNTDGLDLTVPAEQVYRP